METFDVSASVGPNEVIVKSIASAFSTGTELGAFVGDSAYVPEGGKYPRAIGYNNVGRVIKIGRSVREVEVGQRVLTLSPHQSVIKVDDRSLIVPIPEGVRSEEACLAYLCQLSLAALQRARCQSGAVIGVVGLGVVGLGAVALAKALKSPVLAIANSKTRGDLAERLGAVVGFEQGTRVREWVRSLSGDAPGVVILSANPWLAYQTAVELVAESGTVSVLGFPGRAEGAPEFNPFHSQLFYAKQIAIIASGVALRGSDGELTTRANVEYILGLMQHGDLDVRPIISHRLKPEQIHEAFDLASRHSKDLSAAIFVWES